MQPVDVCGIELNDYIIRMEEFHGYRSPGMLLGGFMIDRGLGHLGPVPYLNVVVETVVCLPDAVQLLTPCTFGNGFMQVLDWGKFAITAYDRQSLAGIRVWLDQGRLAAYPLIRSWFERTGRPRNKPPFEDLANEIFSAQSKLIRHDTVQVLKSLKDTKPVPTGRCPGCNESYPLHFGKRCPACSDQAYYRLLTG